MATRDLVPRADSEGGIGTTLKRWAAAWFDAINGKDISSGVATTAEVEALSTTYAPLAKGVTNGDAHDHYGGDGAQIDHGALFGLTDDDHTQYALVDGTRAFSGIPSCAVAPTTGNNLVNKTYADSLALGGSTGYIKADCSIPFTGGHIPAEGEYTGFKFTETDAPTNEKKLIYQVDNSQASLLFVNDAETVFNSVWTADRSGATPTYFTVTPPLIAYGGVTTDLLNGQDISDGVIPKSLLTAPGDLIAATAAGVPDRLGIGSEGQVLRVSSAAATGSAWADAPFVDVSSEVSVTAATTLTSTAFGKMHVCSGTAADYTVGLPAASGNAGKIIGIRISNACTKLITLDANDSESIDGAATRVMWAGESAILLCDGGGWTKIAGKSIPMVCKLTADAVQSIPNLTTTTARLDAVVIDTAGLGNIPSNNIMIRRGGIYTIVAHASIVAETMWQINVGSTFVRAVGSSIVAPISFVGTFTGGATVGFSISQFSGAALNTAGNPYPNLSVQEVVQW